MANKITDTKYYSAIADAIRAKNGSSDTYYPADMAQAIEDIPSGGGNEELLALLAGNGNGEMVVRGVESLHTCPIQFSNNNYENGRVTSLEFPDLVDGASENGIAKGGFLSYAYGAPSLENLILPKCTTLYMNNTANNLYSPAFQNLQIIDAPELTAIVGNLRGSKLKALIFPKLTYFGCEFPTCTVMTVADLGLITQLYSVNYAFNGCSALEALVLRSQTAVALSNSNFLGNTKIASGTGYIYVPHDLIPTYESATNWSTYAGQFRALEDYTDDGTLTGEFIMPTA